MTIGILSDTHGYLHPAITEEFAGVDLILHAGDIGSEDVLNALEQLAPVQAVYGNVDGQALRLRTAEHQRFDVEGLRFWMTHIAGRPGRWQRNMGRALAQDPPDVFICGHSHILQVERVQHLEGMLFINPGAAGRQGFHQEKTCLRLRLRDGAIYEADVIHLDRSSE